MKKALFCQKGLIDKAIRKARKSFCRYRISAIGFNKAGDMIGILTNKPRFCKFHGGLHAEMALLYRYPSVKTIVLCRVGAKGNLLPIHPCKSCGRVLAKLKIKVLTLRKEL